MTRSGTVKTLGALVAAMTLGTWALIWMETAPARPMIPIPLQAADPRQPNPCVALVRQTDVPLQYIKWRNVIVHDSGKDGSDVSRGCHFLIGDSDRLGDGEIRITNLWKGQSDGRHILVPGFSYNSNSIGICLLTDGVSPPTARQFAALVSLVQALQATCQIPRDHVYLHRELGQASCPGAQFPAEAFRQRLLPSAR